MDSPYEIAVVGGGIVGMSFAMQAADAYPGSHLIVLEKEQDWLGTRLDTTAASSTAAFITNQDP